MKTLLASLFVVLMLPFQAAAAPAPATQMAVCASGGANFFMIQPWYACLDKDKNGNIVIDELSDLLKIIFPLVESLVKIGAVVAVGVIFFMIIKMLVARGDTGKIASAGIGIRDALIGLVICLASVAIVNFVAGAFRT